MREKKINLTLWKKKPLRGQISLYINTKEEEKF